MDRQMDWQTNQLLYTPQKVMGEVIIWSTFELLTLKSLKINES